MEVRFKCKKVAGLSPRVRGNRLCKSIISKDLGTIPARAGEPSLTDQLEFQREDYPRACGGTLTRRRSGIPARGLSPRVRGNPPIRGRDRPGWRTIPARAGEPNWGISAAWQRADYPRACGGTSRLFLYPTQHMGLSPRVRGNLGMNYFQMCDYGTIPARAGEPHPTVALKSLPRDYPRACGGTKK